MAVRAFVGFDLSKNDSLSVGQFPNTSWTGNLGGYSKWAKPSYVSHGAGVSPWSNDTLPASNSSGQTFQFGAVGASAANGMAYGHFSNGGAFNAAYTGATGYTRAQWRTAMGHQLAISRSRVLPTLTGVAEIWCTFDMFFPSLGGSSLGTVLSADAYGAIWRWGDLSLYVKSTTWTSGTTHDIVFSIRNGASEVATLTLTGVATSNTFASTASIFVTIHAKLDGSTGLIAVTMNGTGQSVSYTGQNTVATTSEAAATEIYFGPPVCDTGSTVYVGAIDNFLLDDAAFPAGRPTVRIMSVLGDSSLTGVAAAGTSVTTVANALQSPNDAKHARWSSTTGSAELTLTMPSSTGMLSDVLGFEIVQQRAANRYPFANLKIRTGLMLSSVEAEDEYTQVETNAFSSILTPPETAAGHHCSQIFEKGGGGKFQTTDLASTTLKLTSMT